MSLLTIKIIWIFLFKRGVMDVFFHELRFSFSRSSFFRSGSLDFYYSLGPFSAGLQQLPEGNFFATCLATLRKVEKWSTFSATRNAIFCCKSSCEERVSHANFVRNLSHNSSLQRCVSSCRKKLPRVQQHVEMVTELVP